MSVTFTYRQYEFEFLCIDSRFCQNPVTTEFQVEHIICIICLSIYLSFIYCISLYMLAYLVQHINSWCMHVRT